MLECCKTCGLVKFEEREDLNMNIPTCPHIDFATVLDLGDEIAENKHIENLHGFQQIVRIGSKIFGVETNFDPYSGTSYDESDLEEFVNDQLPPLRKERVKTMSAYDMELRAAHEFLSQEHDIESVVVLEQMTSKFTSFDRVPEFERDRMMNEVLRPDLARAAERDEDEDRDPEDMLMTAGRGNRFGLRYRFLGHNTYKALIEPFMWQHVCEHGFHRYTKSVFASEITSGKSEASPLLVNKLAKVLYSETMMKTHEHTGECAGCFFPVPEGEALCPFCADDFDKQVVYQNKAKRVISSMDRVTARELGRQHTTTIADMVQANETVDFISNNGRDIIPFREEYVPKPVEEKKEISETKPRSTHSRRKESVNIVIDNPRKVDQPVVNGLYLVVGGMRRFFVDAIDADDCGNPIYAHS